MKHFLKFNLLLLLFFLAFQSSAQPPTVPPDDIGTEGEIDPISLDDLPDYVWATVNNTNCTAEFSCWFRFQKTGSTIYDKINYTLPPNTSGSVTNSDIKTNLSLSSSYSVTAWAIWVKFGGMAGYIPIYPSMNGTKIHIPGNSSPCDCFYIYFDYTAFTATMRLEPVVAPDTCP